MREYDDFCRALDNLKEGLSEEPPYTLLERTGMIGPFEICFEQAWKLIKKTLDMHGAFDKKIGSPRQTIKTAYKYGMLSDEGAWLDLLQFRNVLTHTYDDEQAMRVIERLKNQEAARFDELKAELDRNWLGEDDERSSPRA